MSEPDPWGSAVAFLNQLRIQSMMSAQNMQMGGMMGGMNMMGGNCGMMGGMGGMDGGMGAGMGGMGGMGGNCCGMGNMQGGMGAPPSRPTARTSCAETMRVRAETHPPPPRPSLCL